MRAQPGQPTGKVILIAEDSQDDLSFLIRAFKEAGILNPVRIVETGEEAIDYLAGTGEYSDRLAYPFPAILFLDWILPGKSGQEVLAWLGQQPQRQHLLVVVLTGQEQRRRIIDAYRLGADSFLSKPVTGLDLVNLVAHFKAFWAIDTSISNTPPNQNSDDHAAHPVVPQVISASDNPREP